MKIYSWNMLFKNDALDRAFDFIEQTDFDIFCLQEVPEDFLHRLTSLSYERVSAVETSRLFAGEESSQYVVILSRYPIKKTGTILLAPFSNYEKDLPLRAKIFAKIMFFTRLWAKGFGDRHAVYADIETPDGVFRVFNIHLPLSQPKWRLQEFEQAMTHREQELPTIVCGDFNILEKPHITPLSWIFGGSVVDALLYRRERTTIEKHFVEHSLHNVLRGKVTHTISQSQLDHILVSDSLTVQNAKVISSKYGSDHHPIFVEITSRQRKQ